MARTNLEATLKEITHELDLGVLLDLITRRAAELLEAEAGALYLWEETESVLRPRAWHNLGDWLAALRVRPGEGIVGGVAATREPAVVNDFRDHPNANPVFLERTAIAALLTEPLLCRSRLLGVLAVGREIGRPPFTVQDEEALALFAAQVAIAIENARLFRVEQERRQQLEAVRAVSLEITRELSLDRLLQLIMNRAAELVRAGGGAIQLWEEDGQRLIARAVYGTATWRIGTVRQLGEGATGAAAQRREGLLINDYPARAFARPETLARGVTAVLTQPLLYRDRLIGVIGLDNETTGRSFTAPDQEILSLFATQAAIAIENARLFEEIDRQRREAEVFSSLARSLNASLELDEVLQAVSEAAKRLCEADLASIALKDPVCDDAVVRCLAGEHRQEALGLRIQPGRGVGGKVLMTGAPFRTADYAQDPRISKDYLPSTRAEGVVAELGVPIRIGDRVDGVLYVHGRIGRIFSQRHESVLLRLADQAAIAIRNASLFQRAQDHRQQLDAVRAVAEEIARELDLAALLGLITRRAVELVGADAGTMFLWDEAIARLVPCAWHGLGEWRGTQQLALGQGLVGEVAQRRAGLIANDYARSAFALPELLDRVSVAAALAEPLLYQHRLLGVVSLGKHAAGERFSQADQDTLRLFAAQAAIAIENARLYAEARAACERLQATQAELIRTEKLRGLGQMAAGIAHDLNNTLAAVLGQVELLQLQEQEPGVREGLARLQTAAMDGAAVVRRLQDFARQRTAVPMKACDLCAVVREAVDITRPRWRDEVQSRGVAIRVVVNLPESLPVLGNPPEIREALINLIFNAVDAMPTGGTLTLAAAPRADVPAGLPHIGATSHADIAERKPPPVALTVTDTGVGIPEEIHARIFEPFFTTKGVRGTGLGLSVVYGIMERHGGRIDVESVPGRGTTFTLRFVPAQPPAATEEPAAFQAGPPRRILLIDDDAGVRETVGELLRAAGHHVIEADGGAAGLERLKTERVDLVLTDLGMPDLSGWEVAREIKAAAQRLPVILMTGWGQEAGAAGGTDGKVDRVLGKPLEMAALLDAIRDLTGGRAPAAPPPR
jgi:GAF domain-containing protein/CheY-like chemotaxis protein